uniref:hypothetical protein n=1 Tax=Segatella hominis TaxID=2518605 RepID=UPI004038F1CA
MAEKLDKQQIKQTFEEIRDERIPKANTARRIGNAFLSLFEFAAPNDEKLSSVDDDTAKGLITFAKGLVSKALAKLASLFVSGNTQLGENGTQTTFGSYAPDASGASISVSENGTSTAEFDFLNIRRAAYFREITIKELKHVGGEMALTAAAMVCSKVEWLNARGRVITAGTPTFYKCYFETSDGKRQIYQEFAVGDQARCQQFRIESGSASFSSTKYYWRLVTAVGDNYIILSNQDGKYDGAGEPAVGDNIVQLGFQGANNPIRTSAIILSATASDAPSTKYYQGITSFSLQDCEVKDEGFEGGQFHSRIYGTYYVGDREQSNYISYDPLTKTATFKGVAIFEPGTTLPDGTPIEQLQNLGIKSGNMLLNSGFTGDYTSQQFDEKSEISDETVIFSDSAKFWETENAEFIETEESASGHAVNLTEGGLAQQISEKLISGEKYTLSFKASGKSLKFTVGGYSENIQLTDELKRYSVIFSCSDPEDKRFRIFEATACVMEITLNQGNLPVQWQTAFDDHDKTLANFEALQYLTAAITEAKTTVNGGLVMTQDIRVGQYRNGKMVRETGGMSGYAATRNSPFIWGGGDMLQAFYTIGKYIYDPGYMATDEELKKMCSFVLTHGGRAILNDIILHGYIYAKGGVLQSVRSPNGNFSIDEQGNAKFKGDSEFGGKMAGVSGSFKRLNCVDEKGNIVGSIAFGSDGKMWFDGDMYSQGYNNKEDRSNRFYTSDVWCRGMLGHRSRTMAMVQEDLMQVFTRGTDKDPVLCVLEQETNASGNTYYKIPLYSPGNKDDTSGMPIDVILFNNTSDYYYSFEGMENGKEWRVINGNDNQTIHFCDIGGWHELKGGASVNCIYISPSFLNPEPPSNLIGKGVFWTGETDLNWK